MTDTLIPALEKMQYPAFTRTYTEFKLASIPSKYADLNDPKLQLPTASTLHQVTQFLQVHCPGLATPDLSSVFIKNETWKVYVKAIFDLPDSDTQPLPFADRYTFTTGRLRAEFNTFINDKSHGVHRILSDRSVDNIREALVVADYAPLHGVQLQNTRMGDYRKFDLIFRTMLDAACNQAPNRHHFIHIPLSGVTYSKSRYYPGFSRLDIQQVNDIKDPSFYFLIHLFGLAYGAHKTLKVTPWPADVAYAAEHGKDPLELKSTSLLARIPPSAAERIHFIVSCGSKAAIYNLGKLQEFARSPDNLFDRLYRHVSTLSASASVDGPTADDLNTMTDAEFDKHVEAAEKPAESPAAPTKEQEKVPTPVAVNTPAPAPITHPASSHPEPVKTPPVSAAPEKPQTDGSPLPKDNVSDPVAPPPVASSPITPVVDRIAPAHNEPPAKSFGHEVLQSVKALQEKHADSPSIQKRITTLYRQHLNVKFDGRSLGELISHDEAPALKPQSLDFMEHMLPEKSMVESSVSNYDAQYMKHIHPQDVAMVLSSFIKHGMFVTDIKPVKVRSRFSRMNTYSVRWLDVGGKSHSFSFTFPDIDEDGTMLSNGVKSRMIKQQSNLPIAKIDDYRVSISTYFNKALVVRTHLKANRFDDYIYTYLARLVKDGVIKVKSGTLPIPQTSMPFEYLTIAQKYLELDASGYVFTFDHPTRFNILASDAEKKTAEQHEVAYGIFCGRAPNGAYLYWDMQDSIHAVLEDGTHAETHVHFTELMRALYGSRYPLSNMPAEYTQLELQSQDTPVVFALGYTFGLTHVLKSIGLKYEVIDRSEKRELPLGMIRVNFIDKSLIFSRYPLNKSLVASGLIWANPEDHYLTEFDDPDVYYRILTEKGISQNFLKGITSFFSLFSDPITVKLLKRYNEPITPEGILLKATDLLSTLDFFPAAMMKHHYMRGYVRLAGTLYNEMAREYATYQAKTNPRKTFSLSPYAVLKSIIGDSAVQTVETINPIQDIKYKAQLTYSGSGGRSSRAFVVKDRVFPKDGVGILSESVPDSGKVGLTSFLTANPRINSLDGTYSPVENGEALAPTQMLSAVGNLLPGLTQDDSKRCNYAAIQLAHHVPCQEGEVCRIRTGFESAIAHLTSDEFAYSAKANGVVIQINPKLQLVKIQHDDEPIETSASIALPLASSELLHRKSTGESVGMFVHQDELKEYPVGKHFKVNASTVAEVVDTVHVARIEEIKDLSAQRHAKALGRELETGKQPGAYYISFKLIPSTKKGEIDVVRFGDEFSSVSGSYLKQTTVLNVVEGQRIKRGDIIAYNSGFFKPILGTSQVAWKHGVEANIALIETSDTLEDGCIISKAYGNRMTMSPAHMRSIDVDKDAVITDLVSVGSHVETSDPLCTITEGDLAAMTMGSEVEDADYAFFKNFKDQKSADYHGVVARIDVYYACPFESLSESLQEIVLKTSKHHKDIRKAMDGTAKEGTYHPPGEVPVGLKYHGIDFQAGVVLIEFIITETIPTGQGDKLCIMSANKTIVSTVVDNTPYTASGIPLDIIYATTSIYNRIVNSPIIVGMANRVLQKLEKDLLAIWDEP